ncbi:MAG: hypothetical protein F4151_11160 [Gammaproteobacteria bacterium]|nr:hypothetical protein [Gammaproteobacteria bacterium]
MKKRAAAGATSRDRRCARHPTLFGILLVLLTSAASTPAALAGQEEAAIIRQEPRWSVEGSLGSRLVGTLYDEFVTRKTLADLPSQTRWKETASLGPEARVVLRHNPVGGAGLYLTLLGGHSGTVARYSGALSPPEDISRSTNYYGVGFGLGMKLSEWDRGRGLLSYNLGTVALTQTIDLSPGHRDAFAQMDARHPGEIEWTSRTSTSWGLDLGASLRVPIGENSALRFSFRDLVIPVNTAQLAAQERDDVKSISSERVAFSLAPFTAHQMSLSAGFEYVFSWAPPRRDVVRVLPERVDVAVVDPAVEAALETAAAGDTARAVASLGQRVALVPHDGLAWRALALLQAPRAEFDPTVRDRTLANLERALNMNPGDTELLRAYGRIRGMVQREGRVPEAVEVRRLELSRLVVQGASDGSLRLSGAARGLGADSQGTYRYAITVEVFDADGGMMRVRPGLDEARVDPEGRLVVEGDGDRLPLALALDLFLVQPEPGIYSLRLRLTDLESGATVETSEGFEVPGS